MKSKLIGILVLFALVGWCSAQFTPPPGAAYTFDTGAYAPLVGAAGGTPASFTPPPIALYCQNSSNQWVPWTQAICGGGGGGGGGTVTNFTAGNLSPLFTTSVATGTTTPALTFTPSTAAQNAFLAGPATGGTGAYSFRAIVTGDLPTGIPNANLANPSTTVNGQTCILGSTCTVTAGLAFPATVSGTATSGGIPYFSSGTVLTSSAALTHYGVVYGGGAGGAPVSTAADTTTTHALFATATAPAFRALAATDLPAALSSSTSVNGTTIPSGGVTLSQTIASGTAAMGTTAIASGACATVVTVSATNVATTDRINWNPNGDPTGVTGYAPSASGSLYIWAYPTSADVNFKVCNNTASSITPSALTLNWSVVR